MRLRCPRYAAAGACLSFLGIVLALSLRWPSTAGILEKSGAALANKWIFGFQESPFAAHDFAGGARLKDRKVPALGCSCLQRALRGDLDTMGTKLPSRLVTYLSVDGTSCEVAVCSAGVKSLLAEKHYAELVNLWKDRRDPNLRYWLEYFFGVWLTTLWCRKRLETWEIANTGKTMASWNHEKGKDLVIPGGLELLQSDSNDTFERRWLQSVKGDRAKCLLHSPERYAGIDYLLDLPWHLCDKLPAPPHQSDICTEAA